MRRLSRPPDISASDEISLTRLPRWSQSLRLIPAGWKGKARLSRMLLRSFLNCRDVLIEDRFGHSFIVPNIHESIGFFLQIDGAYELDILRWLLDEIPVSGTFIDVGANIGTFVIPVSKHLARGGRVVAIEPSPSIVPYLEKNIAQNGLMNVSVYACAAASSASEEVEFFEAPIGHFGMGSLAKQFEVPPIHVRSCTIDEIVEREQIPGVDVVKIDVEGYELEVLEGSRRMLMARNPPRVVFEFCDWAEERRAAGTAGSAQRYLMELGFEIWRHRDFLAGREPIKAPLTRGSDILIAARASHVS